MLSTLVKWVLLNMNHTRLAMYHVGLTAATEKVIHFSKITSLVIVTAVQIQNLIF
jgi:hypothetical protein